MAKRRHHRHTSRRIKEPIHYDPADLSNVVACLGEMKDIMRMLISEIDRIENTPLQKQPSKQDKDIEPQQEEEPISSDMQEEDY